MLILFFHTDLQMKPRCSYGGTKPFRWRSIKLSLVLPIGPYLAHWTTSSLVWWLKARIVAHLVYSAPLGSADSLISPTGMLQEGLSWWSHHKIDTYQFNVNNQPPPFCSPFNYFTSCFFLCAFWLSLFTCFHLAAYVTLSYLLVTSCHLAFEKDSSRVETSGH